MGLTKTLGDITMGRKYASLHIRIIDECTESLVCETYKRLAKKISSIDTLSTVKKLGVSLTEQESILFSRILCTYDSYKVQIKRNNGFISIYDRELSFESVEDRALELSIELDMEVLYASVFDDDVFFFGLCRSGRVVAEHISGQCEAYGLVKTHKNIDLMGKWLVNRTDIDLDLENKEAAEFEECLQCHLGFSLDEALGL